MDSPLPSGNSFQVSQDYEVLQPVSGKAYPILCEEWNFLKSKVEFIKDEVNWYHTIGSVLLGTALTTLVSNLSGAIPARNVSGDLSASIVISWSVFAVALISAIVFLCFASQKKQVTQGKSRDVLKQMELIEKRFPAES